MAINRPEQAMHHTKLAMKYSEDRGMAYNIFKQQVNHISNGLKVQGDMKKQVDKLLEEIREEEKQKQKEVLCGTP